MTRFKVFCPVGAPAALAAFFVLMAGGAFAVTARDYVQEGLLANWDAIDNQGFDVARDAAATDWVDLVDGRSISLTGVTFDDTSANFAGSSESYGELSGDDTTATFLAAKNGTVEIVFSLASRPSANQVLFQSATSTGPSIGYQSSNKYWILGNAACGVVPSAAGDFGSVKTFAVLYADGTIPISTAGRVYVDGSSRSTTKYTNTWSSPDAAKTILGNRASKNSAFAGKICAIRVYSRRLNSVELAANRAVDEQRFVGGSSAPSHNCLDISAEPGLVGPAENYGLKSLDPGASAQLSVPETVVDSGMTYTCAGWCLFDSAGAVVGQGAGNVCSYVHPNPTAFRRLIWVWNNAAWPSGSNVRYVSPRGSDANSGLDWTVPFKTVQKAIDSAGADGTVLLASGSHASDNTLFLTNGVSLVGCASTNTAVTLALTAKDDKTKNVLQISSSADSVVTNLTMTNFNGSDGSGVEMDSGTITHCLVKDCKTVRATDNGGGIYMTGGTVRRCTITGCDAYDTGGSGMRGGGIYMTGGLVEFCSILKNRQEAYGTSSCGGGVYMTGGTLRGCLVSGNLGVKQGSGVWAKAGTIESCTIAGNTQKNASSTATGLYVEGKNTILRNNIIWGNTDFLGETAMDVATGTLTASKVYNNDSPTAINANCIAVDPMFVDAANGDYHLGYSACVNGGSNQTWMATAGDLDGNPRIVNDIVDIGCYERAASTGLECSFTAVAEAGRLDLVPVALDATVDGDDTGLVYYWTFTRVDGRVVSFAGSQYGHFTNEFAAGVWDAQLDVTNGALASASSAVAGAMDLRASVTYVSTNGAAIYPYATLADATPSVGDAFALLGEGGTTYVDEGNYVIVAPLDLSAGRGSRLVSLKGPATTSIRLGNVDPFTSQAFRGTKLTKDSARLEGLTFVGGYRGPYYDGEEYGTYGAAIMSAAGAMITNCVFRDLQEKTYAIEAMGLDMSDGGLYDCRFENVTAHGSGGSGISGGTLKVTGGTVDRIVIDRCRSTYGVITGVCGGDVLYQSGGTIRNALVARCTTQKAMAVGIAGGTFESSTVVCNTNRAAKTYTDKDGGLCYNQLDALHVFGGVVRNCIVAGNWTTAWGCLSNLVGDVTYTLVDDRETLEGEGNKAAVDAGIRISGEKAFHIRSGSPAMNAGGLYNWMTNALDLARTPRVRNGRPDMGCYEGDYSGLSIVVR